MNTPNRFNSVRVNDMEKVRIHIHPLACSTTNILQQPNTFASNFKEREKKKLTTAAATPSSMTTTGEKESGQGIA